MKKALFLLFLAAPCLAAKPSVTILAGGTFPMGKIELEDGGKDDFGKPGAAGGIQLMFPVHERVSVGFDFLNHNFGEKASDEFFPGARATYKVDSRTFLAAGRIDFPKDKLRPFVFTGLGFHMTSVDADLQPQPGFVWLDTNTAEKRKIVDDSDMAFAAALALGLDYDVNPVISLGLEARYSYLAKVSYQTRNVTAIGSTAGGNVKGDNSVISLLARLSFKFGG